MSTYAIPVRPLPYPDESPASILMRAAEANGHSSVFQLVSQVQRLSSLESLVASYTDIERFQGMTTALGLGPEAAQLVWQRTGPTRRSPRLYAGMAVPEVFFREDGTVFCPRCLSEALYWRRSWVFRPTSICLKHQRLLLDRCGHCGSTLSPARASLHQCNHCQGDLRHLPSPTVLGAPFMALELMLDLQDEVSLRQVLLFWQAWLALNIEEESPLHSWQALQAALAWFINDKKVVDRAVARITARCHQQHPRLQLLPFLLGDKSMQTFAAAVLERVKPVVGSRSQGLGPKALTQREAAAVLEISSFQLKALIASGRLNLPASNTRQPKIPIAQIEDCLDQQLRLNAKPSALTPESTLIASEQTWLDVTAIAKRLNVHSQIVRSLFQNGWLKGEIQRLHQAKKIAAPEDEVLIFEQRFILVGTLARQWRTNPTNLREKLQTLGIQPIAGPGIDALATSLFRREALVHLTRDDLLAIKRYPTRTGRRRKDAPSVPAGDGMPLPEVASLLGIQPVDVRYLLQKGILQRTTTAYQPVRVERQTAWKLARTLERKDLMPLAEAVAEMGCGLPWFRTNWMMSGLVTVIDLGLWQLVQREEIERIQRLRRQYVTSTEAGRMLGMHRSHLPNLEKRGLVSSLRMGKNGRLRLYERTSVKALKQKGLPLCPTPSDSRAIIQKVKRGLKPATTPTDP